jgi:predicted metal-dependent hydrolase
MARKSTPQPLQAVPHRIELKGQEIEFALQRSAKRRTIGLRVDHQGLTVTAPLRASERYVRETVQEQAAWILRKIAAWSLHQHPQVNWRDGEFIPYLGEPRRLNLVIDRRARPEAWLDLAGLNVGAPEALAPEQVKARVIEWFRAEARRHLPARLAMLAQHLRVPCPRFFLSGAQGRWGSCSANGDIRLSWRLMKAAPHVIDYVAVHELAHLKHMDHSAAFWRTVASIYPSYEVARKELLLNDALYRTF